MVLRKRVGASDPAATATGADCGGDVAPSPAHWAYGVQQPAVVPLHRRLFHWGPMVALAIVGLISMPTVYCHLMWWPVDTVGGCVDLAAFLLFNVLAVSNLMYSASVGPGYVPLRWRPDNADDCDSLQWCSVCLGYKVPRSHHCRKCGRCVMKMDHHCPWINNCTGHRNHLSFIKFLLFSVIGSIHASYVLGCSTWYGIFRLWYLYYGRGDEPVIELTIYSLLAAIFGFGLALGVIVAVGFLFFVQMRSVLRNRTGVEEYIVAKARARRTAAEGSDEPADDDADEGTDATDSIATFVYPYDLGWRRNAAQVLSCRWGGEPLGDGIAWPVLADCDQYTLTREQCAQKEDKRLLARHYIAVRRYGGERLCHLAWRHGCIACCTQPLAEEARLQLEPGLRLSVTRGTKRWLYGEPVAATVHGSGVAKPRGWFPRQCARRLDTVLTPHDTLSHNGKAL